MSFRLDAACKFLYAIVFRAGVAVCLTQQVERGLCERTPSRETSEFSPRESFCLKEEANDSVSDYTL